MDYILVAQRYVPLGAGRLWLEEVQIGAPTGYGTYPEALRAAAQEQRACTDAALTITVRSRLSLSLSSI
jgi:hypothetical protein